MMAPAPTHTTITTSTLLKCAAVLLALAAGTPTAEGLSCSSSSACTARHLVGHTMLDLEDLFFSSHRWPDGHSRHRHRRGRGSHDRGGHQHDKHQHSATSKSPSKHAPAAARAKPASANPEQVSAATSTPTPTPTPAPTAQSAQSAPTAFYMISRTIAPAYEVRELEGAYELEVELPGVIEDSIEISVAPASESNRERVRVLSLTADRSQSASGHQRPSYARSWELAADVDSGSIDASYTGNGMLLVTANKLPALEAAIVPVLRKVKHTETTAGSLAGGGSADADADSDVDTNADVGIKAYAGGNADEKVEAAGDAEALPSEAGATDMTKASKTSEAKADFRPSSLKTAMATTASVADKAVSTSTAQADAETDEADVAAEAAVEELDYLLSVERKVKELKAKAKARVAARTNVKSRRKDARMTVGNRDKLNFAVEVEAASSADAAATDLSELDTSDDEIDLDDDMAMDLEKLAAARAPSHPGQPL